MALSFNDLPDDVESLKALVLAAHAKAEDQLANVVRLEAERARLEQSQTVLNGEVDRLTAQNERLDHIIAVLRRAQFGRSSERITDDQMALALEDVQTAMGIEDAAAETKHGIVKEQGVAARRANRGYLPKWSSPFEVVRTEVGF